MSSFSPEHLPSHTTTTTTSSTPTNVSSSLSPDGPGPGPGPGPNSLSQYTHRQLQLLRHAHTSTATPLRVIAHIDLDAFYAQCEMVRLGMPRTKPLAVQQWNSLIAINYPAREFGITRMIDAAEARRLCPDLVLQHVATFREGEGGVWAYRDDSFKRVGTDKVSLDPYRGESRKILRVIREELLGWREGLERSVDDDDDDYDVTSELRVQEAVIEKASVDEVFVDLSPLVFGVLLQRFPELRGRGRRREEASGDSRGAAFLPRPSAIALDWNTEENHLVDLDKSESEGDDPDWDDIAMLVSSEIIRSVRTAIWEKLSYTCSAGIAKNKMMAKLGSSCNKPNKQTVVRNRAVQNFLSGFKFTKIRMLGGKLGDQVTSLFGTDQVSDLLKVSLEQFRANLDDDTAFWLYGIIRGDDRSEVNPRTQIKSMLSAKSFRPSINSADQAEKWLRIFAADIYNRLVEDGVLENRRRPKTITIHHRQGTQVRSRQVPIPISKPIEESLLSDLAMVLIRQIIGDGRAWPCANLSLSVGGFEDGVVNNRAIDGFLVCGEQAKYLGHHHDQHRKEADFHDKPPPAQKRRRLENNNSNSGIRRFFTRGTGIVEKISLEEEISTTTTTQPAAEKSHDSDPAYPEDRHGNGINDNNCHDIDSNITGVTALCNRCGKSFPETERMEHDDWHFAKDLEAQDREEGNLTSSQQIIQHSPAAESSHVRVRGKGAVSNAGAGASAGQPGRNGRSKPPEKGQMQLRFGRTE